MNPENMIRILELGLDVLYRGTSFLLSPDASQMLKSGPYNVINQWESKVLILDYGY